MGFWGFLGFRNLSCYYLSLGTTIVKVGNAFWDNGRTMIVTNSMPHSHSHIFGLGLERARNLKLILLELAFSR